MAALGCAGTMQRRSLYTQRASGCISPLLVVAHLGPRSYLSPTQGCVRARLTAQRQASACPCLASRRRAGRGRQLVVRSVAMVNVDFASPSLLLGTALIGCGVLLLNLRNFQNKVSRDADIVVAAMVSIVGSTLIFQGWRLDPLLLLCQALTTSVAFWYGLETFRLRSKEADMAPPPPQLPPGLGPEPGSSETAQQAAPNMQQYYQQGGMGGGFPPPGMPYLPPGGETYYPWGGAGEAAASTSGRAPYGGANAPYTETIQYDYYGNPILPQEPAYNGAGPYNPAPYNSASYGGPGDSYGSSSPIGEAPYPGIYPGVGPSGQMGYGYDTSGTTAGSSPSPSYGGPSGLDVPYVNQAGSPSPSPTLRSSSPLPPPLEQQPPQPPPQQQLQQQSAVAFSLPPGASVSAGANGGLGEMPYGIAYGNGAGGIPAATPAMGVPHNGVGGSAWTGQATGQATGHGAGSVGPAGAVQPARVDLFEKVDDWE